MDKKFLLRLLKDRLSEKKYKHTIGVAETAVKLAKIYSVDEEKAYFAGLLHDITKELSPKEQMDFCIDYKIELDFVEKNEPKVLHQHTGAYYVRYLLNIEDEEIVRAVRYHTTANKYMTELDKIIYIADCVEPNRTYDGVEEIRQALEEKGLDFAMLTALRSSIIEVAKKGTLLHPDTIEAYNVFVENQKN
ncbi:MAG: HD domain-containing protein [Ruminococcaceae bacterium]|nr:HD domain-containing protein [Oscillospiraceae bacterium]